MNTPEVITNPATPETNVKRVFTTAETAFAWLSLLLGYLFCRAFPAHEKPFGAFIFILALYCTTAVVLALNKASFGAVSVICATSAGAMALSLLFTQNGVMHFFAYLYCIGAYTLFVHTAYGNHDKKTFPRLFPLDFFTALFVAPMKSIHSIGRGLVANGKINTRPIAKVLLGILTTLIPTAIIVLLLSYDSDFTDLLDKIFDFDAQKIVSHVFSLIFGIPVGAFIFGAFISAADKKCKDSASAEKLANRSAKARILPSVTAVTAVLPILAVYVLFFVSQWKYYVSGFKGVLPDETVYSTYAREGFFQLCSVAVINFFIIAFVGIFIKRKNEHPSYAERILSVLLSVSTLILIATAVAKMVMYINIYGLTPKRLYASWFMIVLAVIFILTIIKQFAPKLPLILISVCSVTVMFTILSFAQPDRIIAEYNVDRYLDGTLEDVDTTMLSKMGDAAIPSMVKVLLAWEDKYGYNHEDVFENKYEYNPGLPNPTEYNRFRYLGKTLLKMAKERKDTVWSFTLLRDKADDALAMIGLDELPAESADYQ